MLPGEAFASFLFQQQGLAGLEGQRGDSSRGADFERLGAKAGYVEAEIMLVSSHFDSNGTAARPRQLASAGEALVSAFKGLHCQNGPVFNHDGLTDLKAGDLLGEAKAEFHVR